MKTFKCPNCKRVYTKEDKIVIVSCVCGYMTELVDPKTHEVVE